MQHKINHCVSVNLEYLRANPNTAQKVIKQAGVLTGKSMKEKRQYERHPRNKILAKIDFDEMTSLKINRNAG